MRYAIVFGSPLPGKILAEEGAELLAFERSRK